VLVVEDSPDDLELYGTYLTANGFTVTTVEAAANALSAATSSPVPDVILLDLVLGREDGLAVAQALGADSRSSSIPIVAITAAVPRYLPEVALKVGCSDFLTKPCLPGDVANALHAAIARRARPPA
jgi:putative two-component system response regulator